MTKKTLKATKDIAIGGLQLSAISAAGAGIGGTNLAGSLVGGFGSVLPATGSLLGAGLVVKQAKSLRRFVR